jgi:hypothetical protein
MYAKTLYKQGGEYSDLEDKIEVEQSAAAAKDVADSSAKVCFSLLTLHTSSSTCYTLLHASKVHSVVLSQHMKACVCSDTVTRAIGTRCASQ